MTQLLKQSTAKILRMGPFVDQTDGYTAETGLTIAQADIQISKNGGAFAQTSASSPTTTHDADGWYQVPLTATDTGTLGPLTVQVAMSGALPVWEHFMVVPAAIYESLVSGTPTADGLLLGSAAYKLAVDSAGKVAVPDTQKVDVNTIKTQDVTTGIGSIAVGAFVGNATAALAADASGRVDVGKVAGTAQTARDLGADTVMIPGVVEAYGAG